MNKNVIFVDDDELERRSCVDVLKEIFSDTNIQIQPFLPLPMLADYAKVVAGEEVAAFILDEKLNAAGGVTYTGAELAAHLRAIGARMPIVILTNHLEDDFEDDISQRGWAIECAYGKKSVLRDPATPAALEFKARLTRQIDIGRAVYDEREQKFHDLLVKSMQTSLTPEEERQLDVLEENRLIPQQAAELVDVKSLEKMIAELKANLDDESLGL